MKPSAFFTSSLVLLAFLSAGARPLPVKVVTVADHADARYRCGEVAVFTAEALGQDGERLTNGVLRASVDNFGLRTIAAERTVDLAKENPFVLRGSRATPGFLRLNVAAADDRLKVVANAGQREYAFGVGYEPERIAPGTPEPADFDAFWAEARRKLDATVPEDVRLEPVPEKCNDRRNYYRISFATSGGLRVHGWYSEPKALDKGPYPARVYVPGAGPGAGGTGGEDGRWFSLTMNVHHHPVPADTAEAKRLLEVCNAEAKAKFGVSSYATAGVHLSREDYYFHPTILGLWRAVDWLARRPGVDAKDIRYTGSSQGGAFGIILTALSGRFAKSVVLVPAMTDLLGFRAEGRQSGWPRLTEAQLPENRAAAERNAPYFCAVNFARRIRTPIRFVVGFADCVCPPQGIYSAYNVCPAADKAILPGIGMGHASYPALADEVDAWQNGAPGSACGEASSTVPVGRSVTDVLVDARRYYPGSQFEYCAWAPDGVRTNAAVYVILEHACKADRLRPAIFGMMADGRVPPGIVVIWHGGGLPRGPKKDQPGRRMRASQLDQPGTEFPNLLVEEVIPDAARRLGVTIHPSPDFHFITGGSSGGLAAWNAAWFRNDFFHRTYLSSPTFSAMRGGEEPMTIVRKCETRPLRIYMTVGTVEPDYYFGDSFLVALNAASAFRHAGYDCRFEVFEHEGHCARREDPDLWSRMLPWLFEGWRTNATVVAKGNPPRVRMLLSPGSAWEPCDFTMPAPRREAVSTDGWRVYSVAPDSRFVMSEELRTDGSRTNRYVLSNLHLAWNARRVGGNALAVLEDDRVLVATELGVQGVVSFGITDLVLPLPGDLPADNIAVVGRTLYAASGAKVFRRELAKSAADPTKRVAPSSPGYGDGPYVHEHLPIPEVVRP